MKWPELPPCPYLKANSRDDVRIAGSRIDLSLVIHEYYNGLTPEEMVSQYPSLDLENLYGVLTFYMGHRELVDRYVAAVRERADQRYQEYLEQPPSPLLLKLRAAKAAKKSA